MKKALIAFIIIAAAIQFFTIDKTNPPSDINKDFINITNPPSEIGKMIKSSCYDCHSHNTKYPWYSSIAPVSWLIKEHVNNGRKHLNFSLWSDYRESKKNTKLDECLEMVKSGEMPMKGYVIFHEESEISHESKMEVISWFLALKDSL